jgi:hypothetical protein
MITFEVEYEVPGKYIALVGYECEEDGADIVEDAQYVFVAKHVGGEPYPYEDYPDEGKVSPQLWVALNATEEMERRFQREFEHYLEDAQMTAWDEEGQYGL